MVNFATPFPSRAAATSLFNKLAYPLNIVEPNYYSAFRCTGSDCEDTCCSGMGVVIDKQTYDKYQAVDDVELGPLLREMVVPNPRSAHPATFALVMLEDATCPLLSGDKLCRVHARLGAGYLSRTCDTYPRGVTMVDDTMERALYLSCPEAAKLILLNPSPIEFRHVAEDVPGRYSEFPTVDTSAATFGGKPYAYFDLVREFVIGLLQNRSYDVWQRLTIVGMYCAQMTALAPETFDENVPLLTNSFLEFLALRQFDGTLDAVVPNSELLINVAVRSLEDRIATEYTSPRFLACYHQFLSGIGYAPNTDTSVFAANYERAKREHYLPFMATREHIWENFLVSKAQKDLLPFGPQTSLYPQTRTLFDAYVILAVQFLFARTLLVGIAGDAKLAFSEGDVVRLVQSLSRAVEHNTEYMNKILRSLSIGRITDLPVLATLIKE